MKKKAKKKNVTLDDLAGMVANGFEGVGKELSGINYKLEEYDKKFQKLEEGQEQIKLRLDNVAYRFELVELQRRVKLLEKKVGVRG